VWPSLSADTLNRVHKMLLEQPHLTVQHLGLLAGHFGVDKKHMKKFIEWRSACLHDGEELQRRPLPPIDSPNDVKDAEEADTQADRHAHLPTPACSISPEPRHRNPPAFPVQMIHYRPDLPSVDTSYAPFGGHGVALLPSPTSATSPRLQSRPLQGSLNTSPTQADPLGGHLPPINHLSSPLSYDRSLVKHTPPSDVPDVLTGEVALSRHGDRQPVRSGAPATSLSAHLLSLPPIPTPCTLREFEEAYAPTSARIERFLRNVERGKFAHIGLTPEMLKKIKDQTDGREESRRPV
jgi:hypothetical protein